MNAKYTILAIDDNETGLIIIKSLFDEVDNVVVDVVGDGKSALKYLEKKIPSIVLLDLMLPDITGFEVLKFIREDEETKNIPVVIISANDVGLNIEQAYNLGATDYVMKPIA